MKKRFFLLFLLPALCRADNTNEISYLFGRGYPRNSVQAGNGYDKEGHRGTAWSIDALHKVAPQLYLGIGNGRYVSEDNISYTFIPNTTSRLSSKITSIMLIGRADLLPSSTYVFYAIAGVGWDRNSIKVTASPATTWADSGTSESRVITDDSADAIGYMGGLGIDVNVTDRIVVGFEARYQGSDAKNFDLTSQGTALTGQVTLNAPVNAVIMGVKIGVKY